MPSTSRSQQRAEARYNVTTEFPRYDLHHAAASGNLGLVEFALSHGQPINSVLNGVLPLHAACAGGSEVVVKYLIDEGADVNAIQLPRRYSNEKSRTSSGVSVGASGSTPLHFAAANGHSGVVKLLLENGAHPDRADKHGVTPEMLARENGWIDCAEMLRAWAGSREGDLPPHAGPSRSQAPSVEREKEAHRDVACELEAALGGGLRRLQMKRSIDNALHLLKHSHHSHSNFLHYQPHHPLLESLFIPPYHQNDTETPSEAPTPPAPLGGSAGTDELDPQSPIEPPDENEINKDRRPSLPHLPEPAPPFQRRTSGRARRPRSAGTDADQGNSGAAGGPTERGSSRGLRTKVSLLGLFRKGHSDQSGASTPYTGESADGLQRPPPVPLAGRRPSASVSIDTQGSSPTRTYAPTNAIAASGSTSPPSSPATPSPALTSTPGHAWYRSRLGSDSYMRSPMAAHSATELHRKYSRERSGSDSGRESSPPIQESEETARQAPRPSILKGIHHRSSSSSGGGQVMPTSKLRFDTLSSTSTSNIPEAFAVGTTASPLPPQRRSPPASRPGSTMPLNRLRMTRSVSSLQSRSKGIVGAGDIESAPPEVTEFGGVVVDRAADTEAEQLRPLPYTFSLTFGLGGRRRGDSFASSASSSNSPGLSPDAVVERAKEFPFGARATAASTLSPASQKQQAAGSSSDAQQQHERLDVPAQTTGSGSGSATAAETRLRGDSVSSMETDGSAMAALSQSSSTSATTPSVTSPPPQTPNSVTSMGSLKTYIPGSDSTVMFEPPLSPLSVSSTEDYDSPAQTHAPAGVSVLRTISGHMPLDLRSISSHAEAEALLAQTRREISESAELAEDDPNNPGIPLSEQLAALGEIIALERRFARGMKQREHWAKESDSEREENEKPMVVSGARRSGRRSAGSDQSTTPKVRRGTIEERKRDRDVAGGSMKAARSARAVPRPVKMRRPHTAEGSSGPSWHTATSSSEAPSHAVRAEGPTTPPHRAKHAQSRSASATLHIDPDVIPPRDSSLRADIRIIETTPTPVDSPQSSETAEAKRSSETDVETEAPPTIRSRTPDPVIHHSPLSSPPIASGVPLVRVATAPLQDGALATTFDARARRSASAMKLAKMGFGVESPHFSASSSPSPSSSRSPSKARFGIRSFVQSLKGK